MSSPVMVVHTCWFVHYEGEGKLLITAPVNMVLSYCVGRKSLHMATPCQSWDDLKANAWDLRVSQTCRGFTASQVWNSWLYQQRHSDYENFAVPIKSQLWVLSRTTLYKHILLNKNWLKLNITSASKCSTAVWVWLQKCLLKYPLEQTPHCSFHIP